MVANLALSATQHLAYRVGVKRGCHGSRRCLRAASSSCLPREAATFSIRSEPLAILLLQLYTCLYVVAVHIVTLARACAAKGYCSRSVGLPVCVSVCSHVFSRTVAAVDTKRRCVGTCNGRSAQQESGASLSKNSMFTAGGLKLYTVIILGVH